MRYVSELARRMSGRGHDVVCVMKDAPASRVMLGGEAIPVLPAPVWKKPRKRLGETINLAEVLINLGYLVTGQLASVMADWRDLFRVLNPDLLVVNHAPSALLAARDADFKVAHFGTGFSLPPRLKPIPSLVSWKPVKPERLERSENALLKTINAALAEAGCHAIEALHQMFKADDEILVTFSELDHYPDRPGAEYAGPVISTDRTDAPVWPHEAEVGRRIFCYLKPGHPGFSKMMTALAAVDAHKLVFVSGTRGRPPETAEARNFTFSDRPVNIRHACRQSDLVVCHSGHGTVAASLLEGAPLVMLPAKRHLEQTINARNVVRTGAGVALPAEAGRERMESALKAGLENAKLKQNARAISQKYANYDSEVQLETLTERLESLVST